MKNVKKISSFIFCLLFIPNYVVNQVDAGPIICGFDIETGIHQQTKTLVDPDGYDMDGYKIVFIPDPDIFCGLGDNEGREDYYGLFNAKHAVLLNEQGCYDYRNGYNRKGFNRNGLHKDTKRKYDPQGYDLHGFDSNGIHKYTKTKWSPYLLNRRGIKNFELMY